MRRLLPLWCALLALGGCGGGGGGGGGGGSNDGSGVTETPSSQHATGSNAAVPSQTDASVDIAAPDETAVTEITLLAVISDSVTDLYPDPLLRIQHLVNVANDVVSEAGILLEFRLVHTITIDYPDGTSSRTALDEITFGTAPSTAPIAALRDHHQADLVVLFRPYTNDGFCGYAWIGGYRTEGDFSHPAESDFGYSVVSADCSDYTLLHEMGHNLGLVHSRREDPHGGSFSYGAGHGHDNDFVTIMATPGSFNAPRLPMLSSPQALCHGKPCGVDHEDADNGADAVRAVMHVKDAVAGYR